MYGYANDVDAIDGAVRTILGTLERRGESLGEVAETFLRRPSDRVVGAVVEEQFTSALVSVEAACRGEGKAMAIPYIPAIKELRTRRPGLGLKEAKALVDVALADVVRSGCAAQVAATLFRRP